MKATIKKQTMNKISMAIVAVCVLFVGSSVAVAEETLLLASLTRITPLEDFENYDKFPGYQREAVQAEDEKEIKVEMDIIEEIKKADRKTLSIRRSPLWHGLAKRPLTVMSF